MDRHQSRHWTDHTLVRVGLYALTRGLMLFLAVAVSLSLTILVTSRSGVLESEISGSRLSGWLSGPARVDLPNISGGIQQNVPPLVNFFSLLFDGLTFNFVQPPVVSQYLLPSSTPPTDILPFIASALSRTLVLFGTANILVFVFSLSLALGLSRRYGSRLDKLIISLAPLSAIPAWIYALVITIILARIFHIFPGRIFSDWPPELNRSTVTIILKAFAVPIFSLFISKVFQSIYTWRTLFLIQSHEDYVELAKAKGLSDSVINRRYVLRPALPYVVTSFSMMIIAAWQEAVLMEVFFGISGIGHLFYVAMRNANHNMIFLITLTAVFAYLLAISVFALDIIYALIDPRVRVGNAGERLRIVGRRIKKAKSHSTAPVGWNTLPPPQKRSGFSSVRTSLRNISLSLRRVFAALRTLMQYPSAIVSLLLIGIMVIASIYTITNFTYGKTVSLWRSEENVWEYLPKKAAPAWINHFRFNKLPETQILTAQKNARSSIQTLADGSLTFNTEFSINYTSKSFPQELTLRFNPEYVEKRPFLTVAWITPDGRTFDLGSFSLQSPTQKFYFATDKTLIRRLKSEDVLPLLFQDPASAKPQALPGTYQLKINAIFFEKSAAFNPEVVIYGLVHGWAGTDNQRRDLSIPLLWGMPIALALGLFGAVLASLTTMLLAATGSWFGGWIDRLIQAITEVNMVLPAFPLMVMVYINISKSIWVILSLALLLSVGGSAIKNYRAAFLQVREAAYIEAAIVYGAGHRRIIFQYLMPRLLPVLIPQLVSLIPGIFFLEATLAYLNISDPYLPTWGKLLQEALAGGALNGAYHWVLEPLGILLLSGLAFALLGFALDRLLNPRLRTD